MRLTCLRCGVQLEAAPPGAHDAPATCACGAPYPPVPHVYDTGVRPNLRAAERSRSRAFQAAGLVSDLGGFALKIACLGVVCFPLGLVGAALGLHAWLTLRPPLGRYGGRRAAQWAVLVGGLAFVGEGALALAWWRAQGREAELDLQAGARDDLRALWRAHQSFVASAGHPGRLQDLHFTPPDGRYSLCLGTADCLHPDGTAPEGPVPLPEGALAVAYRARGDGAAPLDVWVLGVDGTVSHPEAALGQPPTP